MAPRALRLAGLVGLLVFLVCVAALLVPAGAGAQGGSDSQTLGPCDQGWVAPTPTVIAVTSVPITVSSTENDYFFLYVKHDRGSGAVTNVPVSITRGESGTTSLSDSLSPLGADKYRVEKYLVANPADVDGDCVDDITELDNFGHRNPTNPAMPVPAQRGSVALKDRAAFEKLSYKGDRVGDRWLRYIEFVKFNIANIDTERPKLWFQNTSVYRSHFNFLSAALQEVVNCCWSGAARGSLIYYPNGVAPDGSLGVYRWEFQTSDSFAFREVAIVNETLATAMPFLKGKLAYYPFVGEQAKNKYKQQKSLYDASRVNILLESDIPLDAEYAAYNVAEGYGLLGVFEPGELPGPRDIAILSVLPNDLPRAAGVITTVPQTPLSHVNLRAIQNGTPNAFMRDALIDKAVTDLLDSYVYYRTTADGFTLRAATKAEVDEHHSALRPQQTQTLQRDLTKTSITSLSNVSFADWTAFGVKAANVAELTKVSSLPTGTAPVGYAVPFYFYDEFMKQATVSEETILGKKKAPDNEKITLPAGTTLASAVTQMLAHSKFQTDADIQEEMLDDLRKAIKNASSPAWIITALTTMHGNYPDGQSLRYRSSTNNEDLADFNGAGLYDSKTQDPDETVDDGIDKSIKAVWASMWNYRAFQERDFYRVDHTTVAMGVLVHPNYSDEKANGVAVSYDPVTYLDGYYYVNTQIGENLVTNPEANVFPEKLLLDPAGAATILGRSNIGPRNKLLMTDAQMIQLRDSLKAIHDHFETLYNPGVGVGFAVEIEFKITAQNQLAIKQARPWVFSQPLSACVPQLPTDAVTADEVQGWRDANNNPDHVRRWNRVLAALGVDTGETKLTAAESKALEAIYTESRWERTTRTLAAIEICHPSTAKKTPVISIVAGNGVTEGGDAEFTVSASPAPSSSLDVTVEVTQSGDFVTTGSQTVTIPTSDSFTLAVPTASDSDDEADGSVTATVNSGAGYIVSEAAGAATVAVSDDDLAPVDICVTALTGDGSVTGEWTDECDSVGRSGRYARFFTFSLDKQALVRIDLESSWDTYLFLRGGLGRDGPKLHEDDDGGNGYNSRISKSLAAGDYTIEATTFGPSKTGAFTLSVVGLPDQAPPAAAPEVSVAAGSGITEGGDAVFTVTASPAPAADLDVTVAVAQSGDFGATTGVRTVTIPTSGSYTLTVATSDDSSDEADGSVTATLNTGAGYTVSTSNGAATVAVSDDDAPEVSIASGGDITEGGTASFTLTASPPPAAALTVGVTVSQSGDYGATTGAQTVTIPTGGSYTLTVATSDDSTDEADGSVTATVNTGTGYTVSSSNGAATVAVSDDDPPAQVCVLPDDAVTADEVTGWRDALDPTRAAAGVKRWNRVLEAFGIDTGAGVSPMTATQAQEVANWLGNTRWDRTARTLEAMEQCDSPPPAIPSISISAGSGVTEGSNASFTITASPTPAAALDVSLTVSQSGDFGATTGAQTVTIPTGGTYTLTVATSDDRTDEADGSVTATVNSGTGYTVSSSNGAATVVISDNDDPPATTPEISIAAGSDVTEGGTASFIITASPTPQAALSVSVTVSQSGDYGASTGLQTVSIPTSGSYTLTVATSDDSNDEADGSVTATLNSGTGYTVSSSNGAATVAVVDDDDPPTTTPEISIAAGNSVTEGSDATFTISASPAPTAGLAVSVTVSQSGDFASSTGAQTVTIPTAGSYTLTVATTNDSADEADGTVTVTVNPGTGYTVSTSNGAATVAVSDDDPAPQVCVLPDDAITADEVTGWRDALDPTRAAAGVKRWNRVLEAFGVDTGAGVSPMTATQARGVSNWLGNTRWDRTSRTLEAMEQCDSPPPATPGISISAGSGVTEGSNASFTITASPTPAAALDVSLTVSQSGDFGATTGVQTVIIPTGGSYTLTVATSDDDTDEADGSVTATLNSGTGYTVSSSSGSATVAISDDDDPLPATPEISIVSGSGVTEGTDATFTITASPAPAASLTVSVTVSQSGDYGATIGARTVTIPTSGSYTLTIATSDDSDDEADGSVTATLNSGTGYTVSSSSGSATVAISDDDDPLPATPEISIVSGSGVTEGTDATFTITASPAPAASLTVRVTVSQSGDYGASIGARTVTIPTSGSYTLTIATTDDSRDEADGSVTATVNTGTGYTVSATAGAATIAVADDDVPEISIAADGDITEGGNASFTFIANPSPRSALSVSVAITQSGEFGVAAGSRTITIPTTGSYTLAIATDDDSEDESEGSVTATVNEGSGYTVLATAGTATVNVADDDEPAPESDVTISVADASGPEGGEIIFKVTLSKAVDHEVRVRWETASDYDLQNYAIDTQEFWLMNGWLTFDPGDTEEAAEAFLNDDSYREQDEAFSVKLSQPTGATIADGEAVMTIIDDD